MKLHRLIFAGMALGVLGGLLLWQVPRESALYVHALWALDLVGKTLFVGALKMLVAPLIFASIVAGVTSLPSTRELGSLGWKTLAYYLATTATAVLIGLALVSVMEPGHWPASKAIAQARTGELEKIANDLRQGDAAALAALAPAEAASQSRRLEQSFRDRYRLAIAQREDPSLGSGAAVRTRYEKIQARKKTPLSFVEEILGQMIQNPFHALSQSAPLGIILFALLLGLACITVGARARPVVDFFQGLNAAIMELTHWVMALSPVAVLCLMAALIARHGPETFHSLAGYILTVLAGIALHVAVLLAIVRFAGGRSPWEFLRGIREAWLIAFSTRSSAATLPVTLECVEENLGVPKKVSEFVLPIGATMNMDGTALYEGVAIIFLLQMFGPLPDVGIALGPVPLVLIFLTAVLASIGAAAVPDAGLITMVLVANAVGLPEYYLVFVFSVDAFLDMFRTSTNVLGDAVGALVLTRWEGGRLESG